MGLSALLDILFPPHSKRRLFASLASSALSQPRAFFQHLNSSSLKYFLTYLRHADPGLIEKVVNEVLAQNRAMTDTAAEINGCFLTIASRVPGEQAIPYRTLPVDVIVPVFNAFELTSACITSLLAHSDNCRLILVNDYSTDVRIRPLLDEVRGVPERNVEVIVRHNELNLGFVKTVNATYSLTSGHFVVLNSDTEVPPGWLDRLFAPIFADSAGIASVTPFSNAGMACGFPEPNLDSPIFKGLNVADLDRFFRMYSSGEPIELFTGVGFCMAFNRNVVERIGLFDEVSFGRGYGEETDWSLRAFDAGYQNVLAPNLFVYHQHGGSFSSEEKTRLMEQNLDRLWGKHPRHLPRHREFLLNDELRAIRDTMAVLIDAGTRGDEKRVIVLDVDFPGGGTVYSNWMTKELRDRGVVIVHCQYNFRQEYLKVRIESPSLTRTIILSKGAVEMLPMLLNVLSIDFVIINELFWWPDPKGVMKCLTAGELPYLALVHDYFMLCPSWLLNEYGDGCRVPDDVALCQACLSANKGSLHRSLYEGSLDDIRIWRSGVQDFLARSRGVVCFSGSSAEYFSSVFPKLANVVTFEHAVPNRDRFVWKHRQLKMDEPIRLGIIGSLFSTKGERIVKELIESDGFKGLRASLHVFGLSPLYPAGYTSRDGRVSFTGSYEQKDLPAILERQGIHVVIIPSILPETFSYTTSEAILLGYPVICFNLGAQAERLRRLNCGIIADDISSDGLLTAIRKLLDDPVLVGEFSLNAKRYVPPTADEHFGRIAGVIAAAVKTRKAGVMEA